MRMLGKTTACAVLALSLAACEGGGFGGMTTGETVGTLGGAAGGALLGSQIGSGTGQIAATAVGTLLGAYAGREIARHFGQTDRTRAHSAEQQAVAQNSTVSWNNPQSGYGGTVQPLDTYRNASGQLCREYTHTINVEGRTEAARGTACQQTDGTWRLAA
ncbi:RT0821/Lpp0805 family surface protein [Azospirillum halopraeferens]|uniref:RT0821/Lpp0805 family surface protein n=1 Tax=Azospirillum halopraeferens TaxID=34010 RepID=UPI0004253CCA|nr:RT0821/Lpp0805 family surface protein [Azospirillum halopraeferens]